MKTPRGHTLLKVHERESIAEGSSRLRVVIIGAGFAGLRIAQQLANTSFEIILFNRDNYHTFAPLLHQVATAELSPDQIACPIRKLLRRAQNISFQMSEVISVDPLEQVVETQQSQYHYDFLVIATGSRVPLERFPGAREFGFPLKTIHQAVALRNQIVRSFEQAAALASVPLGLLTFAIVGGGATGVELAGALQDWIQRTLVKDYPNLNCQEIRVVLLQSKGHLLPGFSPRLQAYTNRHLQRLGIDVRLHSRVGKVSPEGIVLTDGRFIPACTVVWTTGVRSDRPTIISASNPSEVTLLPTLQTATYPNLYVVGDSVGHLHLDRAWPQLAAVAVQQGKAVARNLQRQVKGKAPQPFRYRHKGNMAILSRYAAVVQLGALELTGPLAWIVWLLVHLMLMRGHRVSTLIQWWSSQGRGERSSQTIAHLH